MTTHLEINSERKRIIRYYHRMSTFNKLSLKRGDQNILKPDFDLLQKHYQELSNELHIKFPECREKTTAEKVIAEKITEATKLKFYPSCWIPGGNVDFFFPCITTFSSSFKNGSKMPKSFKIRGLVLEIDGVIHDQETKMQKDEIKLELLYNLGIGLASIENRDLYKKGPGNLITKLNTLPRLDSRARDRVWKKIYNSTLLYYASDELLEAIYGPYFIDLCRKYHNIPNSNFYK